MPLTLDIPDEIARPASAWAKSVGLPAETVLLQALQAHFLPLPLALLREFDAWNDASDSDFAAFEQRLADETPTLEKQHNGAR